MMLPEILFVTDIVDLGGGEISLLNHLKYLDRGKFKLTVLCPVAGRLTTEVLKMGIDIYFIYWNRVRRIFKLPVYYPFLSSLKLSHFLRKHPVKIINVNTFSALVAIGPAAKVMGIPLIWTCHGWWPAGAFTGKFINLFTDKVIAVSGFVRDKLLKQGHVNPSIIEQIPLGIDISGFHSHNSGESIRREFNLDQDVPVVGMIGRFQRIKGHDVFVRMANEISKKNPDVRFMIVGSEMFGKESESEYAREVRGLIRTCELEYKMILTGFRTDIPDILNIFDVLVVPSEIETFGVVILEAMAMGVPVVCCAKGGPEEIIEDKKNGFQISRQEPAALAHKVLYLLANREVRRSMGLYGKHTVSRKYRIEDQVKKTESVYTRLAGLT